MQTTACEKGRSPPRWDWRARPAPLDLQPSPTPDHKLKQMRSLLRRPQRGNMRPCIFSEESSPHCPATSSQLQNPVSSTLVTLVTVLFSPSSLLLSWFSSAGQPQPCSSPVQSTDESSWICSLSFAQALSVAPQCLSSPRPGLTGSHHQAPGDHSASGVLLPITGSDHG